MAQNATISLIRNNPNIMSYLQRKLFASLLVFSLVFTNIVPAFAADEEQDSAPEQSEQQEQPDQSSDEDQTDSQESEEETQNEEDSNEEAEQESEENTEESSEEADQDEESTEQESEEPSTEQESDEENQNEEDSTEEEQTEYQNNSITPFSSPIVQVQDLEGDLCENTLVENGAAEITSESTGLVDVVALEDLLDGDWDVFDTIPGWYTDYGTSGIEVHRGSVIFPPHSGEFLIELDSHENATNGGNTNSAMSQDLELVAGDYSVSFAFRPRRATVNDNTIEVLFDDVVIGTADGTDTSAWVEYEFDIPNVSQGDHKITFRAAGEANSFGGLLDSISLNRYMTSETDDCSNYIPVFAAIDLPFAPMCTENDELVLQIRFTENTTAALTVNTLTEQFTDLSDGVEDGVINVPLTDSNGSMLLDTAMPSDDDFDGLGLQRLGNGQFELMQGRQLSEESTDILEAYLTLGEGEFTAITDGTYAFENNDQAEILDPTNSLHWFTRTTGGRDSKVISFTSNCDPIPTPPFNTMCSLDGTVSLQVRFYGDTDLEQSVTTNSQTYFDETDGVVDGAVTIPLSDFNGVYFEDTSLPESFDGLGLQRLGLGEFRLVQGPSDEVATAQVYLTLASGEFTSFQNTPSGLGELELTNNFNFIDQVEILDPANTVSSTTYASTGYDDVTYTYTTDCEPLWPLPPFEEACTIDGEQMLYVRFTNNTNTDKTVTTSTKTFVTENGVIQIPLADSTGAYIVDEEFPTEFDGLGLQRLGDGSIKIRQSQSASEELAKKIEAYLTLGTGNFLSFAEGSFKLEDNDVAEILDPANTFHFYGRTTSGQDELLLETENSCELPPTPPFENICELDEILYLDIRFLNRTNTELLVSTESEDFSPVEGVTRIPLTTETGEYIQDSTLPSEFLGLALQRQGEGFMTLSHGSQTDLTEIHAYTSLAGAEFTGFESDSLEGPSFNYQDTVEILDPANTVEWHTFTTSGSDTVILAYGSVTCSPAVEEETTGSGSGSSVTTTGTLLGNNSGGSGGTQTNSTDTNSTDQQSDQTPDQGEDTTPPAPAAFTPVSTFGDTEVLGEQIEDQNKNYIYAILAAIAGFLFLFFAFKKKDEQEENAS